MFSLLTRTAPWLIIAILIGPVGAGLAGTLLPAIGILPAAGLTTPSFTAFAALAAVPGLGRAVLLSLGTGLASTVLALALALLTIALLADRPVFAVLRRMLSPLLAVPHAAAAFGLAMLIMPSGIIARWLSPWATGWDRPPDLLIVNDAWGLALTLGLVAKETPFLVLMLIAALPQADAARRLLVSRALGYGRLKGFAVAVAPVVYRQVRLAVFAVIVYGASNVDMAMVLGPTTPPPLAVLTLRLAADPDLSQRTVAAAAAMLQFGVCAFAILLWIAGERIARWLVDRASVSGRRAAADHPARVVAFVAALFPPIAIGGGLLALALWSVAGPWSFPDALPQRLDPGPWVRTLPTLAGPLTTTLLCAVTASLVATALVLLALEREEARGRRPGAAALLILYAPLLVPQIAFLFGLSTLAILAGVDGSLTAVLVAHLVFVLPYVYLSLAGPWRAFDRRHALAARTLGASSGRVFMVVRLPMLLRPIATALALGFAVSVAQYLPTLLVGGGRVTTITTEALALSAGQDRRIIGVVALVQALLPALAFAAALAVPAFLHRNRRGMAAGEASQ